MVNDLVKTTPVSRIFVLNKKFCHIDPLGSGKYFLAKYTYATGELISEIEHDGYPRMSELKLNTIRILGASKNISSAILESSNKRLPVMRTSNGEIRIVDIDVSMNSNFRIKFI